MFGPVGTAITKLLFIFVVILFCIMIMYYSVDPVKRGIVIGQFYLSIYLFIRSMAVFILKYHDGPGCGDCSNLKQLHHDVHNTTGLAVVMPVGATV